MRKPLFFAICLLGIFFHFSCSSKKTIQHQEVDFNRNWKFYRDDIAHGESPELDDADWRIVDVPHDYSIEDLPKKEGVNQIGPFSEESEGGVSTGHVVGGTAWYRKHFTLNNEDKDKIIKVLFDGIYMNSDVWINGHHLGNHPYGYTAFAYDLTVFLNTAGKENILAVQVKNEGKNSRWYSGSGIYRNVTLIKTNPVFVDVWGVYITTPKVSTEMSVAKLETTIQNTLNQEKELSLKINIKNAQGEFVASSETPVRIKSNENNVFTEELEIVNSELWSVEQPALYTAEIQLIENGKLIDQTIKKFGMRSIDFSIEKGFLLNGNSMLLKGACLHHDNGILGAAAFERSEYRKVQIMKNNGYNAIRTAHNPPSSVFLDACDSLGMLVIDESFDQWQRPKNPMDYNLYFDQMWEKDMESMLLRDRNHPSIIIWSFGNEISERADSSGLTIAKNLINKIHELDKTRPATQAICKFWEFPGREWEDTAPAFALLDVHAYNYEWRRYEDDHDSYPERIMLGTESIATEAFENWQMVEKNAYVIGDFVWTGMDYFGESGIGRSEYNERKADEWLGLPPWPWYNGNCGDIDIIGNKKPQSYFRDVIWNESKLEMAVHEPSPKGMFEHISQWGWPAEFQSWNWEGNEGVPMQVSVYTRCEEVRLELNGRVIGTRSVSEDTKLTVRFEVPYEAGELTAIGLTAGKEISRKTLVTTGKPFQLKLTAEHDTITGSPNDLAYFNVEVLDENGIRIPNAEIPVTFSIEGNYTLQAVGNANPTDMHSFQQPQVNTFQGRCQLIVRSSDQEGQMSVTASSTDLKPSRSTVTVIGVNRK